MKYLLVAGARPNFMKIAPIHKAFSSRRNGQSPTDLLLVQTGQHYSRNKSDDFFRDLGIPEPDINLEVGSGPRTAAAGRSGAGPVAIAILSDMPRMGSHLTSACEGGFAGPSDSSSGCNQCLC